MTSHPSAIMLFAAGFGTRMGALTESRPKPLIKVAGKALIDHALDMTDAVQPDRVVVNLHYKADMLADHLTPRGVMTSLEEPNILETGGGLKAALPQLGKGPVFTMNTDAIWAGPNPLELLQEHWDPVKMDALLMCVPKAQTVGHFGAGDFSSDADGRIRRGTELVYGGIQILKTEGLAKIDEPAFSLNLLWDEIQKENRLFALTYSGEWCDVGRPESIAKAEKLVMASRV